MTLRRASILAPLLLVFGCATQSPSPPALPAVTVTQSSALSDVADAARRLAQVHPASQVWVAFDLDNTLLAMRTELGANQWYDWQSELSREDPCNPHLVTDRLAVQGALYHLGAMRLTDDSAPELIRSLASAGHPILIVTARGADFRLPTFRELRRNHLDFEDISPKSEATPSEPFLLPPGSRPVLYEDGVLMLAGQHKGHMLFALVDHLDLDSPGAVVFADDKAENVEQMRESLVAAGISGHLVQFTGEDGRVATFDGSSAAAQWLRLEPALQIVESVMGTDNHDVPDQVPAAGCTTAN